MRFTFIPWIVLSTAAFASGEVTLPCSCDESHEPAEAIETMTRDISLGTHARAESLESVGGSITLARDSRVSGHVETGRQVEGYLALVETAGCCSAGAGEGIRSLAGCAHGCYGIGGRG